MDRNISKIEYNVGIYLMQKEYQNICVRLDLLDETEEYDFHAKFKNLC